MAQIFAFGRVEDDLAPKKSQHGSTYVCFRVTEQTGKGQFQSYQVWAWDDDVSRLTRLGIKKGSYLWFTGTLQLADCTSDHGKSRTRLLKVYLSNFGFIPARLSKETSTDLPDANETADISILSPAGILDGDRETLPE